MIYYVRPVKSGGYGNGNGKTYETAFNGFSAIKWGNGGIGAGDELYVCGTHCYGTDFTNAEGLIVGASGTSASPITIRGDYQGDPGQIVSARRVQPTGWTANGDGTYWKTFSTNYGPYAAEGNNLAVDGAMLWPKNSQAEVAAEEGSWWVDASVSPKKLWYNPIGDTVKTMYFNFAGSCIRLNGASYINITRLKFYCAASNRGALTIGYNSSIASKHVNITWCDIAFCPYTGIYDNSSSEDILIEDCSIHECKSGTYTIPTFGAGTFPRWAFRRVECYGGRDVYDFWGARSGAGKSDRHALGGQNLTDALFDHCNIHDWPGDGIINYCAFPDSNSDGGYRTIDNTEISYCIFNNLNDAVDGNYHYAIARHGDNGTTGNYLPDRAKGWNIHHNIFMNIGGDKTIGNGVGACFRTKGGPATDGDVPAFDNNVCGDFNYGVYTLNVSGSGNGAIRSTGNTFQSPKPGGFLIFIGTGAVTGVDIDYQVYWPDTQFAWRGNAVPDLASWRVASLQDMNSIVSQP